MICFIITNSQSFIYINVSQTEENEQKFAAEAKKDLEEEEKLKAAIKKDEELLSQAQTKQEKAKLLAEEKVSS
jgi:hypothetical protein